MRRFLFSVAAAAAAASLATADDDVAPANFLRPHRPLVAPLYNPPATVCPPGTQFPPQMPGPGAMTPPNTGGQPTDPNHPPGVNPLNPPAGGNQDATPFAQPSEAGTLTRAGFNPNLFGDVLGARSLRIGYSVPVTATFGVAGGTTTATGGPAVLVDPNAAGGSIQFGPTPNGRTGNFTAAFSARDLGYTQPLAAGGADFDRAFARSALQTLLSNGQLTPEQINSFQQLSPADRAKLLANRGAINAVVTRATNGLTVPAVNVTSVDGRLGEGHIEYTALLSGETTVALPLAGSVVGRIKTSEDNSPLPRDRVIVNYDSFGGVPLTSDGIAVNRFQLGFEKTFGDGGWSAEVRLPFAGTLSSTTVQGAEGTATEVGNLRLALKRAWVREERYTLASGVSVALPTASDQRVLAATGDELYRFRNQSVQVEPYVAALLTPTDRLFAQVWSGVNFDVSGGRLEYNANVFGGSGSTRVWDLPLLYVDGQVGYWVVKRDTGWLRGLAPFVELHWNRLLAQDTIINAVNDQANGFGLSVSAVGSTELNLTAGVIAQLGDSLNLSVGAATPLMNTPDRTFDFQVGVRLNYLFGATARERNLSNSVGGY